MSRTALISLATMIVSSGVAVADGEPEAVRPDAVVRVAVDRVEAPPRDPALLGEPTVESETRIAELQRKLMEARQHPKAGPPFESVDVPSTLLVPRNPATDPGSAAGDASSIVLHVNSTSSDPVPVGNRSEVAEPAVAASGERVFYTGNWFAAQSSNAGTTFSYVNPFPGPYPSPGGESFCCDQAMTHDPGTNATFWLQQFIPTSFSPPSTNTSTQRINVDQNSDGSWDCAYDINTVITGVGTNTWFDFPDLTVSSNYLYHASNAFTMSWGWAGGYVGRYPLAELASCSTPLTIDAFTSGSGSFRLSRGADDTMYFAAQPSNSSLRIWSWPDAAGSPTSVFRSITPWADSSRVCPGPDGRNWCGFHDGRIQSGFLIGETVGFIWTPSQGGGFPYPYMRVSTFDASSGLAAIDDIDIWSSEVAYMYPSASVNADGVLGGTVMWGGGTTHYPSCSAWAAATPTASDLVPLDQALSIAGTVGPSNGNSRSGDYTTTVTYYPDDSQFVGACFAYLSLGSSTTTFVRFGVGSGDGIFADDFEGGTTGSWSTSTP
jgi:hypothetical protein